MTIENTYVALCDILGFGDLVLNAEHEKLKALFDNIFNTLLQEALSYGAKLDQASEVNPNLAFSRVHCLQFSDSLLFWTNDDSAISFQLLLPVLWRLFGSCFAAGIPLRGAVTHGVLEVDQGQIEAATTVLQTRILGKSVVDAYRFERDQIWSGCMIDPLTIEHFNTLNAAPEWSVERGIDFGILMEYEVPRKKSPAEKQLVIDWTGATRNELYEPEVLDIFSRYGKAIEASDVKLKIENTNKFIEAARKRQTQMKHIQKRMEQQMKPSHEVNWVPFKGSQPN
ncbi:MAG TPA: hypothetical protein VEW28_02140 [Candidatus Kapabacteria bacterium]|nr:hypothetical protein [Candidatus Kapabacteria bacterium]